MSTAFGLRSNLLAICLLSAAAGPIWAQQSFVPTVIAAAGAPSTLLFGLYGNSGSLVRSQDLGHTWTPVYITQAGLPQPPVGTLVIDPTNSNTVYVATTLAAGILWKSTDGGNTWTQAISELPTNLPVGYFTLVNDTTGSYLYIQLGDTLYVSANGGASWSREGALPTSSGTVIVAPSNRLIVYYIDAATLNFYVSQYGGQFWPPSTITVPGGQGATIASVAVPAYDPNDLYVTVNVPIQGQEVFASLDGAAFTNQSGAGLGPFTSIASAITGPMYAFTNPVDGFFRSLNSGQSWQSLGVDGLQRFGATAIDPNLRSTLYGLETQLPATQPEALVQSIDSGVTWTTIAATVLPTIAKPAAMYNITLEQGAPFSAPFSAQLLENTAWITPVTVSTTGESWIALGASSGSTPLGDSFTISTTGLLPGTYLSTITISASGSYNKSVSIPVNLTVKPAGALGPGYLVSTAAGNGSPASGATTGAAPASLPVGDVRAVAMDPLGNVDFSAGNRLWQFTEPTSAQPSGLLTALAGNGVNASSCNGSALSGSLADPDGIAFDGQGAAYLPEYSAQTVCKYSAGNLFTALNLLPLQESIGVHTVVLDPLLYMLLPVPSGILRFDGAKLTVAIPAQFSNPYSMLEDASGNFYVSDMGRNQVFKVTPTGTITSYAGTGVAGFGGDGGPASQGMLSAPAGIAFDSQGTLYIADSGNSRIRTVTVDGNIHTIAGTGLPGFAGDGMTADYASFQNPLGVAVDASGNVWIADTGNFRLRELTPQNTPTPQPRASNPIQGPNVATTLSPGSIFSLYGALLAPAGPGIEATSNTWPRSINDVSVTINGVAAPLYYVSPTQINGQIPFETPVGTATALIAVNGSLAAQVNFSVVAAQPDVLVQGGGTQAVAVNQNGSVNTPSNPAHGGDVEVAYLTGIGVPNTAVATGAPSPSTVPLAMANYPYSITLNGQQTSVGFLGYAPGFPALVQANFTIPQGLTGNLSLVVTVNGQSSAPTIVTVQ